MLSAIAILAPKNAYFQPFSKESKYVKIHNTFIPSPLQTRQNSLVYDQLATKSQETPSRRGICKDNSELLVE